MTIPTHLAFGLAIGAWFGHPAVALAAAVIIDADHLVTYARHGILTDPKRFWKTVTDNEDPYGNQRGIFHSLFVAVPIWVILIVFAGPLGLVASLSYASHLLLDLLDTADYWPLYPSKKLNIRGPVPFFSKAEALVALFLLAVAGLRVLL